MINFILFIIIIPACFMYLIFAGWTAVKEILRLQDTIEKMKKCENCKHYNNEDYTFFCIYCKNYSRWELKE